MHKVAVLAFDGVIPFDLGIPLEVFGRVSKADDGPAYAVSVCAPRGAIRTNGFTLRAHGKLADIAAADTVVVPGIDDVDRAVSPAILASLRDAWASGARVVSICSGAFLLGAAGLLDGKRATTHWLCVKELARRYPLAQIEPDALFVDQGRLVTSAGASAGLDMCLHLVRQDHGAATAADAARIAVTPLIRDGGQAQFIRARPAPSRVTAGLAPTLDWMLGSLAQPLNVKTMAKRAGMSERSFARHFHEQIGTTPLQWLLLARVRVAQELLEVTNGTIEEISLRTGFESPVTFRARFRRIVGLSPLSYRRRFQT
ncbi:MAG TPA: helix-turn-helix domain-containing protein [Sphingobium sp.]